MNAEAQKRRAAAKSRLVGKQRCGHLGKKLLEGLKKGPGAAGDLLRAYWVIKLSLVIPGSTREGQGESGGIRGFLKAEERCLEMVPWSHYTVQ